MCQAVIDIRREGVQQGVRDVTSVLKWLYASGRGADVQKALEDEKYMKRLMKEFQKKGSKSPAV